MTARARRLGLLLALPGLGLALGGAAPVRAEEPSLGPRVLHLPVLERKAEQGILTPVPLEVSLPPELAQRAARVLVHYRVWGDPDWTALELARRGARWTGAVPCLEISTITGDLRYYIRAHDADGGVIASSGSRVKPYRVTIRHDTVLGAKAQTKARCPDPNDCPAGLLGCPSEKVELVPCKSDRDCEGGATCGWRGFCETTERELDWVSLSVEQGVGIVSTTGMCTVHAQENEGSACFRQRDGVNYTGNPVATNQPLAVGWAPTRIHLGYERVLFYQTSVGARVGYAVAGEGPTLRGAAEFVPWSLGLRATHWFGEDPFGHSGLRPYAFLTAGFAQVDVTTEAEVREDPTKFDLQGGNDLEQTLDAHKRAGDGFAGLGVGLAFAPRAGSMYGLELAVLQAFPYRALVLAPTASAAVGF